MAGHRDWRGQQPLPSDRFTIEGLCRADADRLTAAHLVQVPAPKSVHSIREEDGTYTVVVTFAVRIEHHNDNQPRRG